MAVGDHLSQAITHGGGGGGGGDELWMGITKPLRIQSFSQLAIDTWLIMTS